MNLRRQIIMAELYWAMDRLLLLNIAAIAESEEQAEEVEEDIKAALDMYCAALSQLSEAELIELHHERLLKETMGRIESVS